MSVSGLYDFTNLWGIAFSETLQDDLNEFDLDNIVDLSYNKDNGKYYMVYNGQNIAGSSINGPGIFRVDDCTDIAGSAAFVATAPLVGMVNITGFAYNDDTNSYYSSQAYNCKYIRSGNIICFRWYTRTNYCTDVYNLYIVLIC